jgi:hypothetical protein
MSPRRAADSSVSAAVLPGLLLLYAATSLLHFAHNARYLADYPNLPAWLSQADVYFSWCAVTSLGIAGFILYRRVHRGAGLLLLCVYALIGFDGLLHYGRAPMAAHTAMMNFTIWAEVLCAALLLFDLGVLAGAARAARGLILLRA